MTVFGVDVGGANLKAVYGNDARSREFALWKEPKRLESELRQLVQSWSWKQVAVTMTGELCDCFATKREGVTAIAEAAFKVFGPETRFWRIDGRFSDFQETVADPLPCAAANWLALATVAARLCPDGVLVDVGSTTCDIVRLREGRPSPRGLTDTARLQSGELIYTGARRTPVCAILGGDGMAEFFATTLDVNLVLGHFVDDPHDLSTADGRPATRPFALARLARMIGGDIESLAESEIVALARSIRDRQVGQIRHSLLEIAQDCRTVVAAGSGISYVREAASGFQFLDLEQLWGVGASHAACARAVAELLSCG
jgi:probable H4MPT-linked C1 transfer pathway protein